MKAYGKLSARYRCGFDQRYSAEVVDITSTDRRLEKVRVRFKVNDQIEMKWVKHPVDIVRVCLDARL